MGDIERAADRREVWPWFRRLKPPSCVAGHGSPAPGRPSA